MSDDPSDYEAKKMNLMAEVSNLKLKFASLEREKDETERRLKHSQASRSLDQLSDILITPFVLWNRLSFDTPLLPYLVPPAILRMTIDRVSE